MSYFKSYLVAIFATAVKYYDYGLFGLSASSLAAAFMPSTTSENQLPLFFLVYSITSMARPAGSIIFGKIADQIGRVQSVKISMLIAAFSTSFIAFIPSFSSFGWWSFLFLALLRIAFMVSLSGDTDAIKILVAESFSKERRNSAIGVISFSSQIGVLFASFVYYYAVQSDFVEFLWRFNFALGGILGFISILLRSFLAEGEVFLRSKYDVNNYKEKKLVNVIKYNKLKFTLAMVTSGMLGGVYHFLIIFLNTYIAKTSNLISLGQASYNNVILIAIYGISCLVSGFLGDRINVVKISIIALILSIICVLLIIFTDDLFFFLLIHKILVLLVPFYSIPTAIKIQSLFQTRIRMRMYSLSHSLGSMFFSSMTPTICMMIWKLTGEFDYVMNVFLVQLFIILFALLFIQKKQYDNFFET